MPQTEIQLRLWSGQGLVNDLFRSEFGLIWEGSREYLLGEGE